MGKFEPCNEREVHTPLPENVHGVNVFAVPELKGRRRMITEPLLNSVMRKEELPKCTHPDRLARRQMFTKAKYMFQIDFEAYYDAIPLPAELRNLFVFKTKQNKYYRLTTLPTGAKWSVCVAQAITWVLTDIDTPVTITTLLDNILIAAKEEQEESFIKAIRKIVSRIREANLLTSPNLEEIANMSDQLLLEEATKNNTFLGEEYEWNGQERVVRNSVKTVAKLELALEIKQHTYRSIASLISLIMYALHTTNLNPAKTFKLMRAYRGFCRLVSRGKDWDDNIEYIEQSVRERINELGKTLITNEWSGIAPKRTPTYDDSDYDYVIFTDASISGWGAVVRNNINKLTFTYQQRWISQLNAWLIQQGNRAWDEDEEEVLEFQEHSEHAQFTAKHSAHAEPRAAEIILKTLIREGVNDGAKIMIVTDHKAIVYAQQKLNGFGGIGRGYSLNRLYEYVHNVRHTYNIDVTFSYIAGPSNPADSLSRNFGVDVCDSNIVKREANNMGVPFLKDTWCPLCEDSSDNLS